MAAQEGSELWIAVSAIATTVYAAFAILQWLAIRKQATITDQNVTVSGRAVEAANRSATAAFQGAEAAQASADAAERTARASEAAILHSVLAGILADYRSAEMLLAIRTLWSFSRKHDTDFPVVYTRTLRDEAIALERLSPQERVAAERGTFHHQRRLVSQFYAMLAGFHEWKVIPDAVLYTYWHRDDLRIIPEVILPLERALAGELGVSEPLSFVQLQKLYDDCLDGPAQS